MFGSPPPAIHFKGRAMAIRLHADTAAMKRVVLLLTLLAATAAAQDVRMTVIATGLDNPVALTHAGDSRLFITLQRGQIVIYDGTRVLPMPFLDIRPLVAF